MNYKGRLYTGFPYSSKLEKLTLAQEVGQGTTFKVVTEQDFHWQVLPPLNMYSAILGTTILGLAHVRN
jgi:hypothetical protein